MNLRIWAIALAMVLWFGVLPVGAATYTDAPQRLEITLGNEAGALHFFPDRLQLRTGQAYLLHLSNPSPIKHYFSAPDFAAAVWTKKVQVGGVEVKGAIRELELKPQAAADWVIFPQRPGSYVLRCTIPGHTEAGMVGTIEIQAG